MPARHTDYDAAVSVEKPKLSNPAPKIKELVRFCQTSRTTIREAGIHQPRVQSACWNFGDVVPVVCRDAWTWARKTLHPTRNSGTPNCQRPPCGGLQGESRSAFGELRKCKPMLPRPKATRLTPGADIEAPISVGSDQALVSGSLQSFLDTSDKVVRTEWLV